MKSDYLAQQVNINGQQIKGPLSGINTLGDLINKVMTFLIPLAGLILFLVLIWGGIDYIFSRGNEEKLKSARAKITSAIIGFVILIVGYLIVKIISTIFGLGTSIF